MKKVESQWDLTRSNSSDATGLELNRPQNEMDQALANRLQQIIELVMSGLANQVLPKQENWKQKFLDHRL